MDYKKLLNLATEMGVCLLKSGGEIYRAEDSVNHILRAYGVVNSDVFAIPNCLIVSFVTPDGESVSTVRRIPFHGTDIYRLEAANDLCRRLCREKPEMDLAWNAVEEMYQDDPKFSKMGTLVAYAVGCAGFCLFFGGVWQDALCALLIGVVLGVNEFIMQHFRANHFFKTVVGAFVAALLALFLTQVGLGLHPSQIIIGAFMVLVPGVAFTNALRDIIAGDMISGISKMAEALLIGVAIALGAGVALELFRGFGGVMEVTQNPVAQSCGAYFMPCLWAFVSCLAFGILYNIRGSGLFICSFGSALSWMVYLLVGLVVQNSAFQCLVAAVVLSAYAEGMARVRKCPVTAYLLVAIFPLVPGGGIYYTMEHALSGETMAFLEQGMDTLGIAGMLAVGILLVSSLMRMKRV